MNELKSKIVSNIIIAVIIGIAVVVSAALLADGVVKIKGGNNRIIVTGSAKQQITSDLIVWTGSFTAKSPVLQDAYAQLESDKTKVMNYLVDQACRRTRSYSPQFQLTHIT
jgi:hypothetical protein